MKSEYGLHLVFVRERVEGRLPALAEIRDAVQRDWMDTQRREAKEKFYAQLRDKYDVSVELPKNLIGVVQ